MASINEVRPVGFRRPFFSITFVTENNDYELQYDSGLDLPNYKDFREGIISLTTKNNMSDDTGVFSISLAGATAWDRVLNANDLILISIYPNGLQSDIPDNPNVMLGMVSEVSLTGDYSSSGKTYSITGQTLAKAFSNFELGLIDAYNVNITDIGWLPDDKDAKGGIQFTGSNAKDLTQSLYDRFIPYMNYSWKDPGSTALEGDYTGEAYASSNLKLENYIKLNLDSWTAYESLMTASAYINWEGSFLQLLVDIAQKPFNELFWETTSDGQCEMILRPTPFDEDKWNELERVRISSKEVISEDIARSDAEAYSVYVVNTPDLNDLGTSLSTLGVFPQCFPDLIEKFGYKKLEVDNRYLVAQEEIENGSSSATTDDDRNTDTGSAESSDKTYGAGKERDAFTAICKKLNITGATKTHWEYIINRESSFDLTATNGTSGAYGLAQANPPDKMSSVAADWKTNAYTQLEWMYSYMKERYGGIDGAYEFWIANNWY
jgi:hypothetical protein